MSYHWKYCTAFFLQFIAFNTGWDKNKHILVLHVRKHYVQRLMNPNESKPLFIADVLHAIAELLYQGHRIARYDVQ